MIKINEIFLSIQGEGISTGLPTVFVRLAGCNLRCHYCDSTYSYHEGKMMTIEDVVNNIKAFDYKRVCITGGEPLLQNEISELLIALRGFEVSIETNGSVDLASFKVSEEHRFTMDVKTPSSGEEDSICLNNFKILRETDEIKFVISCRNDYEWSKDIINKYYKKGRITFSPVFGKIDPKNIVQWILEDKLHVRFQMQLHKIIWHPEERGV